MIRAKQSPKNAAGLNAAVLALDRYGAIVPCLAAPRWEHISHLEPALQALQL
jgi:hypothetical protein